MMLPLGDKILTSNLKVCSKSNAIVVVAQNAFKRQLQLFKNPRNIPPVHQHIFSRDFSRNVKREPRSE